MLEAFILGIIEGITEFLPISSTGHLIVVSDWMNVENTPKHKAFEVIIQFGAILAVVANYYDKFHPKYLPLWTNIGVSIIPICLIGFVYQDTIKAMFTVEIVGWMFIIGGIVFILMETFWDKFLHLVKRMEDVTPSQAFHIGLIQALALIPGTSRAGASIVGGVIMGLDRKTAAEWSFLMALPVLALAAGYDLYKHYEFFVGADYVNLAIGFVTSFVVAWAVMRVFLIFLQRFTFSGFGYYRIAFGILLLNFQ